MSIHFHEQYYKNHSLKNNFFTNDFYGVNTPKQDISFGQYHAYMAIADITKPKQQKKTAMKNYPAFLFNCRFHRIFYWCPPNLVNHDFLAKRIFLPGTSSWTPVLS